MSPASIALKVTSVALSGGILIILFKKIKALKSYGLISIIYILLGSLLLAFPTLFNLAGNSLSEVLLLVFTQIFILLIGILHVIFVPATLPWYKDQGLGLQLLLIFSILFLAFFFMNLSLTDLQDIRLPLIWYMSLLWFIIPVLLDKAVDELVKVPSKLYKLWYYPFDQKVNDPSDEELDNPVIISFIFKKYEHSSELTTFRAKAPVGMEIGRLFYFFINDYNERNPEGPITYLDDRNEPYGWIFKKVRNRLLGLKEVIDPDSSIYSNEIRENDLLYCRRISEKQ